MSLDVFFQGFIAGESSGRGRAEMNRVLAPHVVESRGTFRRVRVVDGEAEIYLEDDGMLATHISGEQIWHLLLEGAQAANWVIIPIGFPVCLTQAGQRDELPEDLEDQTVFIASGEDLLAVI